MKRYDIYLVGVGGQGVMTIADMIISAAAENGISASFLPYKGMAQRGGFCKAELRLGGDGVGTAIPQRGADLVISMELSESLKALPYLKKGGEFVVLNKRFAPTAVMLGKAPYPALDEVQAIANQAEVKMVSVDPAGVPAGGAENIYLLAAALRHSKLAETVSVDAVKQAIVKRWPKGAERNLTSFDAGFRAE